MNENEPKQPVAVAGCARCAAVMTEWHAVRKGEGVTARNVLICRKCFDEEFGGREAAVESERLSLENKTRVRLQRLVSALRWWFWRRLIHPGCDGRMDEVGDRYRCRECKEITVNCRYRSRPLRKLWRWVVAKRANVRISDGENVE